MQEQQKLELMANVMRKGKAIAPDRFPQPNQETVVAWASSLSRMFDSFPDPQLWGDAVEVWAMELVGDRMITPRELKQAVHVTRDRWGSDPVLSRRLEAGRVAARELRDRQLADGSFWELRGFERPALVPAVFRDVFRGV